MKEQSSTQMEAQLLATLRAECARLSELLDLAHREYEVAAEDDFSALFSIVQSRQSVLAEIERHQRDFFRMLGSGETPAAVRRQADCARALVAQISEQDLATRILLAEMREKTCQALQQVGTGTRALGAYRQAGQVGPIACDLEG